MRATREKLKPISVTIATRLRYDYDEKLKCSFFCSCRSQSHGSRRGSADAQSWRNSLRHDKHHGFYTGERGRILIINQTETSLWNTNDETYYDADKRLQALERIQNGLENKYTVKVN